MIQFCWIFLLVMTAIPQHSGFDLQGHRGCRGLMPENSIPAMIKALDLGVTTLEMDAVISSDKAVILSHEPFFNHAISSFKDGRSVTTAEEKSLNIFRMPYAEVSTFDVGLKGNAAFPRQEKMRVSKPLLRTVIDTAEAHSRKTGRPLPFYNIETKTNPLSDGIFHPAPEEFVRLLMQVIKDKKIEDRVIIQSFDFRTLRIVHDQYKGISTAALVEGYDKRSFEEILSALGFKPDVYSPNSKLVTTELILQCHEQNIRIIPWTVNDLTAINRLKAMGVDGIITDYPDLFHSINK